MGSTEFAVTFGKGSRLAIEILEETSTVNGVAISLRPDLQSDEIRKIVGRAYQSLHLDFTVVRNRFFLDIQGRGGPTLRLMEGVEIFIQEMIHVSGRRANSERTYPLRAVGSTYPGTFEPYTGSVIEAWQSPRSAKASGLSEDLRHLGVGERIVGRRLSDVEVDLLINRIAGGDEGDMVSIADVGFGVSQILPVLVALRAAFPGQLVYLEEPEVDLHPRAQVRLAAILAQAAKRGVRVIAESHSTLLLTAVQTLVAKGELEPNLVKLHWFQRDEKTGVTKITSTGLDENGAFTDSEWPEDFDDVILKADGAYLDAVEGRQVR